jgi:hypothetical protein
MFFCRIDATKCDHAVVVLTEHDLTCQPVFIIQNTPEGLEFLTGPAGFDCARSSTRGTSLGSVCVRK